MIGNIVGGVLLVAFGYTVVRWYRNGDARLNSEWFN
ncbi:hypothetical protein SAMN05421809_0296 [Natronorubrum daqingense]|uniref:Uncharacterized protein n=1 Tax=Natronorubrum daqingense TaxID=588898 RepID=A0A1N6Y2V7_9EURY|nr:hypothetical protein SAMN05421809_0296 [Natronorubrum daqingense]